ncbi:MAG: T9SS type A sorting domain-containing protein [Bacteroidales bacterium]
MKQKKLPIQLLIVLAAISLNLSGQNPHVGFDETGCCDSKKNLYDASRASTTDTTHCMLWSYQTGGWVPQSITINTRDAGGRLTEELIKLFQSDQGTYLQVNKYMYTYHSNDSIESISYYIWNAELNGGMWDPISKTSYEYDTQNRLTYTLYLFSQYGDPEWRNGAQNFYYNNFYGMPDSVYRQYWNTNHNAWFYSYRYRYEYDSQMKVTAEYHDWANSQTAAFALNNRVLYLPGEYENQHQEITQSYTGSEWMNNDRNLVDYNEAGLKTKLLFQSWNHSGQMWDTLVMMRELFDYNMAGQLTEYIQQSHYFEWNNMSRQVWDYNDNAHLVSQLFQDWNFTDEVWENKKLCNYPPPQSITSTGDIAASTTEYQFTLAPNPAVDVVILKGEFLPGKIKSVHIINHAGQLVKQFRYQQPEIQVNELPRGLYVVRISGEGFETNKKLLIQ